MAQRFVAIVAAAMNSGRTKHCKGLPPQLTGGRDERVLLLPAEALLIDDRHDGVFLFRLRKDGTVVGDTWHQSVDDALAQAGAEYSIAPNVWVQIPEHVTDPFAFTFAFLSTSESSGEFIT